MTRRPVVRPNSRTTHAELARHAATPPTSPTPRPLSVEGIQAHQRDGETCEGLVLVAVRLAPHVTLEGPEDLAERVRTEIHGRWVRVFGSPHQMFAVGAWPAPAGWDAVAPPEYAEVAYAEEHAADYLADGCTYEGCAAH